MKGNVPVTTMPVPEAVRTATLAPVKVDSQKLADGVWALGGGTHNSMLVEFKDFVAVVEAPQERGAVTRGDRGGRPARPEQADPIPGQHASPFRPRRRASHVLSQGTTVVTHETNKEYYLDIMFYPRPRTLDPDRMAIYSRCT